MKTIWTQHLHGEEKKKFEDLIRNSISKAVVDRLMQICEDQIAARQMTQQDYDVHGWAYLQAHCNGYVEAMRDIQNLFELGPVGKH
jgi:hypothetical protein